MVRDAIALVPEQVWTPAIDADGKVRDGGDVVELTGLMTLTAWPAGTARAAVRTGWVTVPARAVVADIHAPHITAFAICGR